MKYTLLSFLLLTFLTTNGQGPQTNPAAEALVKDYFTVVDKMPIFPGCEMILNLEERQLCTEVQFINFIEGNIAYPKQALDMGCEGTVIVSFIIRKEGSLTDIEILKDQTPGCGLKEETLKFFRNYMLSGMKWYPGSHNGERVNVKMVLPIKFSIQEKPKKNTSNKRKKS